MNGFYDTDNTRPLPRGLSPLGRDDGVRFPFKIFFVTNRTQQSY